MAVTVRAVEEKDIPELLLLMKGAWEHSYQTQSKAKYPARAHEFDMGIVTPERYSACIDDEHGFFFLAEVGGRMAGSIRGEVVGESGFAMIRSIAVHPDFHRMGAGRALMEHALDFLKARGCHKVSLNTMETLVPAINLYLRMGFVPEAYLRKQWWGVDFIYMSKWLDEGP